MSETKNMVGRITHKHDIAANWALATGFIPKVAELIVYDMYDKDGNQVADNVRFKIGDGINNVNALPFVDEPIWDQVASMNYISATDDGTGIVTLSASPLTSAEEVEF